MKKHGSTIVPRNKDMNEYLTSLGHNVHKDKRKNKRILDKLKQEQREDIYDNGFI